jgi:magnesium transporter
LGLINIEQTHIIKIFTVLAMVFMPPTLIASIYGMNFHNMPELSWTYGYPIALLAMLASSLLPYRFFKRKGWI